MGNPNEATQFMEQSKFFRQMEANYNFRSFLRRLFVDQKERCKKKKYPPILIASLPKSASATIAGTFQQILDIPVIRLSIEGGVPRVVFSAALAGLFYEWGRSHARSL